MLSASFDYLPDNSITVAVIDPGVGTHRNAIAIQTGSKYIFAPDNGLLSPILNSRPIDKAVKLTNKKYHLDNVSSTFHGRDIFAPAAAHFASGIDFVKLGEEIPPHKLDNSIEFVCKQDNSGALAGEVIYSDDFGNIISSIDSKSIEQKFGKAEYGNLLIEIGDIEIKGLHRTFSDVKAGQFIAYIGSFDYLEIGIRNGNAAAKISPTPVMPVRIMKSKD